MLAHSELLQRDAARDGFNMPRRVFADEKTRREVWQVSDGPWECVAPYMDVPAWTSDDRFLIFACNKSGLWQPYRLELESGAASQICEVKGGFRSFALSPSRHEFFCQDGDRVLAIDIETLASRVVLDYGCWSGEVGDFGGGKGRTPALSRDGNFVAATATDENGQAVILVAPTDGSNAWEVLALREGLATSHVLWCPGDDNVLSFQGYPDRQNDPNEEPEKRVAQWRIERESGALKPLVLMPPGFRSTHSLWGKSGERFYFHRKSVPNWTPAALCSVNKNGEDLQTHFETSQWKLGHSAPSPDERWLVTDSQDADENPLVLASTQQDMQHLLCWPNMSQKTSTRAHQRSTHLPPHTDVDTHPGWSSTGKYVHYTSDISGRSQIYVVPVGDLA